MGGGGGGALVIMRAGRSAAAAAPSMHTADKSPATHNCPLTRPVMADLHYTTGKICGPWWPSGQRNPAIAGKLSNIVAKSSPDFGIWRPQRQSVEPASSVRYRR